MLYKLLLPLFVSFNLFAGPSCDWKPIKTDTTQSNNYSFQVVTLDCNIDYYKDDDITAQEAVIRDADNNIVVNHIGNWSWRDDSLNYADEVSIVTTPEGFPYQVILSSVYGSSNISHTYHIYSTTPSLKLIGKVTQPINVWQANDGKGSEKDVVGFYKYKDMFLIDRLTLEDTETAKCNACQDWSVETLRITNSKLISLGIREFNRKTYSNYAELQEASKVDISREEVNLLGNLFNILTKTLAK